MHVEPRTELRDLPLTVHGGQGWRFQGIEDFSQNLNPFGPPAGFKEEVDSVLDCVNHYPDADSSESCEALAKFYNLDRKNVFMGVGSSEIIRNFPAAFLEKGDRALIPNPSFVEYWQQVCISGATPEEFPLSEDRRFGIDFESLDRTLRSSQYKALFLCNPNNPTGRVEKKEKILGIVKECEDLGTYVFLDETLLGLTNEADNTSCASYVNDHANLLIAGSFTKSFGVPGLRIGFGLSNPEIAACMNQVRLPWNLGTVEQALAKYFAENMEYVDYAARELSKESEIMQARLEDIGFPVGPVSDTFFYFASCKPLGITATDMQRAMQKEGIMVRDCSSFGFSDHIRFCVKDRERNEKFIKAAQKIMSSFPGQ